MPMVVSAVITDVGKDQQAKLAAGASTDAALWYFRIGEGGYVDLGGGILDPKTPDPTYTRLEADGTLLTGLIKADPTGVTFDADEIRGVGTSFDTELVAGDLVQLDIDGVMCEVATVDSATLLHLVAPYPAAFSGSPLVPRFGGFLPSGSDPWYTFSKAIAPGDLTYLGAGTGQMEALCRLLVGEGNDDGYGAAPEFFELGIYLQESGTPGVLMVYATFPGEIKTLLKQLSHVATLSW